MGQSNGVTTDRSNPDAAGGDERTERLRAISDSMMEAMSNLRAKEAEKRTLVGEVIPSAEGRAVTDIDPG